MMPLSVGRTDPRAPVISIELEYPRRPPVILNEAKDLGTWRQWDRDYYIPVGGVACSGQLSPCHFDRNEVEWRNILSQWYGHHSGRRFLGSEFQ